MTRPASRIIGYYEKHAIAWAGDRRNAPWNDKVWHERFIESLAPGESVLDRGCGSGFPVAAHLHVRGLKVTGVDSSPTMISLCRQRLPDQDWIVADMRNLSLDRRFDGVLAWDSFFHLDHESQRAMFAVFSAHASPGAMLMFNTGPQHAEGIGEYRGDPYHASLSSGEYQNLISQSGFKPSIMLSRTRGPADARYGFAGRGEVSAEQLSEEGRRASRPSHNASSLTCP